MTVPSNAGVEPAERPDQVAVVGGGRMGAGIAQVFAALGSTVVIAESGDRQAALGRVSTGRTSAANSARTPLRFSRGSPPSPGPRSCLPNWI